MLAETVALVPEAFLALGAIAVLCARSYLIDHDIEVRAFWISALGLLGLAIWIIAYGEGTRDLAGGVLVEDVLSRLSQSLVLVAAAATLAIGIEGGQRATTQDPSVVILVLLAVLGLVLASAAGDLLVLFLGLQLYLVSTCALIAQRENSGRAVAAALRAALSGGVGSALVLFGIALVIAASGATGYTDIADNLTEPPGLYFSVGLALLIAGMAFMLALAPFHLWLPPATEAAPWPVVGLMVGVAPLALLTALARLVFVAFEDFSALWQPVFAGLGLLSVFAGAFAAFAAERLSHLMSAFATLGAGFGLLALSAGSAAGVSAMLVQMTLQAGALLGLIAFASLLEKDGRAVESLRDLSGYSSVQMPRAFAALVILLSAAAVPPLAGFVVRLNILQALYENGAVWQSIAGVGAMVLAAVAVLRPVWRLYLSDTLGDIDTRTARLPDLVLALSALVSVLSLLSFGGMEAVFEAAGARLER